MTVQDFLAALVANFGSFGLVTWVATAIIVQYQQRKGIELSNDVKRAITVGTALIVVLLAYFGGAALGYWPVSLDSAFAAIRPVLGELGGAFTVFTASKAIENRAKQTGA